MISTKRMVGSRDAFRVHCEKVKDGPGSDPITLELVPAETGNGESSGYLVEGDSRRCDIGSKQMKESEQLLSILKTHAKEPTQPARPQSHGRNCRSGQALHSSEP